MHENKEDGNTEGEMNEAARAATEARVEESKEVVASAGSYGGPTDRSESGYETGEEQDAVK